MNPFFYLSALIAEIAGTISGFGSSSIFLPAAHQFLDYKSAILIVAVYHMFGNITRFLLTYRHWNMEIFMLFGIPSVIATMIGSLFIDIIPSNILKIILAVVLILFTLYSLFRPSFGLRPTVWMGRIGGFLSGFTAWVIGTGWVLRGAFLTSFGLRKEEYIATIAAIAILVDMTRIPLYVSQWFFRPEDIYLLAPLLLIALLGSYVGKKVVQYLPSEILKKIILVGVIILSALLGYQGWNTLS